MVSEEAFWEKVEKREDGCWRWLSYHNAGGRPYTTMFSERSMEPVYRITYRFLRGKIPKGFNLHHLCSNAWCVNPDHLKPISHSDHARLHVVRPTHCPKGHLYDDLNSVYNRKGFRSCRKCVSLQKRLSYARKVGKPLDQIRQQKRKADRY